MGANTSLAAACQFLLPNGGGLVLNGATSRDSHGTNFRVILSVVAGMRRVNPSGFEWRGGERRCQLTSSKHLSAARWSTLWLGGVRPGPISGLTLHAICG